MGKTLFSKNNIVKLIVTILMVVLSLELVGCAMIEKIEEEERLKILEEENEARKRELSNYLEEIYLVYEQESDLITQEFDKFLEENFDNKEYILNCFKRQNKYNDLEYDKFLIKEEKLIESLNNNEISKEEFEKKQEELWARYEKNKNKIQDYLKEEEIEILENNKEKIKELYEIAKTTKGTT